MIARASAATFVCISALVCSAAIAGEKHQTRNVAIVLYDHVELLDFAGPGEVFAAAAWAGAAGDVPAFHVYTVGKTKAPLTSQGFVKITPEYSIEDAPKPDLVVFPGGGVGSITEDPALMAWAKKTVDSAEIAMSVCNGAFVLGALGALDGKTVTTHFGAIAHLRALAPKASVQEGRRFVDNGHIVTTAGVSAGIDGALHVVARLLGRTVADKTARYMEYRWSPEPYLTETYSTDTGGAAVSTAATVPARSRR
jgi:transcriptional regulator GlxA family with amidase domain